VAWLLLVLPLLLVVVVVKLASLMGHIWTGALAPLLLAPVASMSYKRPAPL
jgi:hypothetical protein